MNSSSTRKSAFTSEDLENFKRHNELLPKSSELKLSNKDYEFIRKLIYQETRIDLGDSKRELVTARLGKRLRATKCPSFADYCNRLKNDAQDGELYHLIDAISTNHTFFFREINHFKFLNSNILPEFASGKMGYSKQLKVWSCACSTGEEPYSLAITLSEFFANLEKERTWRLDCSDISTKVLDFASKGIYEKDKLKQVRLEWQRKYFQKGEKQMDGYFRIHPNLRKMVHFKRLNLFDAHYPWTQKFNLIFCRNVMIYFDRQTQEQLVKRLSEYLEPGGYLMIGHAESLAGINHPYESVKPAIYRLPNK